jgi:hypothetical protein
MEFIQALYRWEYIYIIMMISAEVKSSSEVVKKAACRLFKRKVMT